jgi:hypothetical protein
MITSEFRKLAPSIARWLQEADHVGDLSAALESPKPEPIAMTGMVVGWTLGSSWPPAGKQKPMKRRKANITAQTTRLGFINRNNQKVLQKTDLPGNDHNQLVYITQCQACGTCYGANGSDIFQPRCPACAGDCQGLPIDQA